MESEGSLPHSQVHATCPYPEPARSNPYPQILHPETLVLSPPVRRLHAIKLLYTSLCRMSDAHFEMRASK